MVILKWLKCTNPDCKQPWKDESEFYRCKKKSNGRASRCKECQYLYTKRPEVMARIKAIKDRYRESDHGKAVEKAGCERYRHSEHGYAMHKASKQNWEDSEQGKAWHRSYKSEKRWKGYPKSQFAAGQRGAADRDIYWGLEFSEWVSLVAGMSCHYCDGPLSECGVCLDRKDNDGAYIPSNCVPCCPVCNCTKMDHFTYDEMVKYIGPSVRKIREERIEAEERLAA